MQFALLDVPTTTEIVYYATDMLHIKIGRTTSWRRRGGELKAAVLLTFNGGQTEERRHHRMWSRYRIGTSEWFEPGNDLLLWLATNLLDRPTSLEARTLQHLVRGLKRDAA